MRQRCEGRGVRFAVAIYPCLTLAEHNPFRPIDLGVIEACKEQGVECFDLLEAFPAAGNLMEYWASVFDTHPDGEANARVADYLAEQLRKD